MKKKLKDVGKHVVGVAKERMIKGNVRLASNQCFKKVFISSKILGFKKYSWRYQSNAKRIQSRTSAVI